jgi:molybdopterin-guanine dinucleotide biosynthesis protein A
MRAPIGLVLAGGVGRRLGRTKGDLRVDGRPLALRAAEALQAVCEGVMVSVGGAALNPAPGFPAVPDAPPAGRGPLAGLAAGFEATEREALLVLACDYPRVGVDLLREIVKLSEPGSEVVLVQDGEGRDHPLVALWRRSVISSLLTALAARRHAVKALLGECSVQRLGPEAFPGIDVASALLNVNRPEDLDRLQGLG